jgi:hypothetical protein
VFSDQPRGLASPEELGTTRSWNHRMKKVIPSEEHSPMSWMGSTFPMLEVIGSARHCARPQISLKSALGYSEHAAPKTVG